MNNSIETRRRNGAQSTNAPDPAAKSIQFPPDVVEELEARYEDRLVRFLQLHPDASEEAARISARQRHQQYVVTRRTPCYNPEYKGPCLDPLHCVARDQLGRRHAARQRWAGQDYIPDWIKALAIRIGPGKTWHRITFTVGPGANDDAESIDDMVRTARQFSRRCGFRWDEFLCRRDPRSRNDNRIISASRDQFLLEARVRLAPGKYCERGAGQSADTEGRSAAVSGVPPARTPRHNGDVRKSTPNISIVAWSVAFDFQYYGPELSEATIARLQRKWLHHRRNRGRSRVNCRVVPIHKEGGALHDLQGYRLDCLDLSGSDRVRLDRVRAEYKLRRIFRLGAGRGQLRVAKQLWAETLATATHEAYHLPVKAGWAAQLTAFDDATPWSVAMKQLETDDRTPAHRWRWHRRQELYRERLEEKARAVSLRPSSFVHDRDSIIDDGASPVAHLKKETDMNLDALNADQLADRIADRVAPKVSDAVAARLETFLKEQIAQLRADFKSGLFDGEEYARRYRKLQQTSRRIQ